MKLNRILICCVNYNSYDQLIIYLDSIEKAVENVKGLTAVKVVVCDNSSQIENINIEKYKLFELEILINDNLGYLGASLQAINKTNLLIFDYVIISNVDVILSETFFVDLHNNIINSDIAWIAPSIFSLKEKKDINPKMLNRLSLKKIKILLFLYSNPWLYNVYENSIYKLKTRKKNNQNHLMKEIYAGHGSFMIFNSEFLYNNSPLNFFSFLFGEEIFFAEMALKNNMKVIYDPKIIVYDLEHISTGKLKGKDYCKLNYDSILKIRELYYEQN